MRFRGTLVLLVVLAALGAYVLLVERHTPVGEVEAATPVPTSQPPLLAFASADARVVRITGTNDGRRTEFAYRDSGLWHITHPVVQEADQGQVVRLVEELADLRPRRALTETTAPLADYGLDPPAMRLEVEVADGSRHAVLLGARNADGSGFYAQVDGQPTVYLVPSTLGTDAERYLDAPPAKPTPTLTAEATPTPQG
jgi:hypothetical protein